MHELEQQVKTLMAEVQRLQDGRLQWSEGVLAEAEALSKPRPGGPHRVPGPAEAQAKAVPPPRPAWRRAPHRREAGLSVEARGAAFTYVRGKAAY